MCPNIVSFCWHEKDVFWHTLGKGEQTQVAHFVSELCLSWQNEACCSASAFCCVYTVYATHGRTHRHTQHLHCCSSTQTRKILFVGWNTDRRDWCVCFSCMQLSQRVEYIWSWEALFQLHILFFPPSVCSVSISIASNCFLTVTARTFQTSQWQQREHLAQTETNLCISIITNSNKKRLLRMWIHV